MNSLYLALLLLLMFAVALYFAIGWARSSIKKEKEFAQQQAEERAKDAEVASKPFVPNPLGDIRRLSQ